jgi:hypothetical protein
MVSCELEFRGINLEYLGIYFEELGAKQITHSFPYIFKHHNWNAEILTEEVISLTRIIKVNQVHIRFNAESKEFLEELILSYRKKTTRVGG